MPNDICCGYRQPGDRPIKSVHDSSKTDNPGPALTGGGFSEPLPSLEQYETRRPSFDADGGARFAPGSVEPVYYNGPMHLLSIAPTRAGKGRYLLIPTLLTCPTTTVVIDPKGELARVTAAARLKMGHRVYIIDPFNVAKVPGFKPSALNPLDVLAREGADVVNESQTIAHNICESAGRGRGSRGSSSSNDPFWDCNGKALLSAFILATLLEEAKNRTLATVYDKLHSDDVVYETAVLLDTKGGGKQKKNRGRRGKPEPGHLHPVAAAEMAVWLQMPELTRGGVLSTTQSYLKIFSSDTVLESLGTTSFSVDDFIAGEPMTIYLVLPVDKLASHGSLLRMWISTLMRLIYTRVHVPDNPTLFLVDEAAQLGYMDELEKAMTVGMGYGLQVWTFWQDFAQLTKTYPESWQTIVNNCGAVSCFGARSAQMRAEFGRILGIAPSHFTALRPDEHLTMIDGEVWKLSALDYLRDSFGKNAAENPAYITPAAARPKAPKRAIPLLPNGDQGAQRTADHPAGETPGGWAGKRTGRQKKRPSIPTATDVVKPAEEAKPDQPEVPKATDSKPTGNPELKRPDQT